MKAKVIVTLKNGVLDPQGKAIQNALFDLGFEEIANVRQGKFIELDIDSESSDKARERLEQMCQKLLANTVIENFQIEIV